jgi:hypothetical protein
MSTAEAFNRSGFSRFINGPAGRVFRLVAGLGFLVVGYLFRDHPLGVISMLYSILPLSAGAFDICWISAVLGGPLSGSKIRKEQHLQTHMTDQSGRTGISASSSPS